jgi:hypothetical protein
VFLTLPGRANLAEHVGSPWGALDRAEGPAGARRRSWIVPPTSGGRTPVFHRYYPEMDLRPAFHLDDEAAAPARDGTPGCPYAA